MINRVLCHQNVKNKTKYYDSFTDYHLKILFDVNLFALQKINNTVNVMSAACDKTFRASFQHGGSV